MRVGIDAHFVGVRHGGNEHHFEHLLRALAGLPLEGDSVFLFNFEGRGKGALPGEPFRIVDLRKRSVFLQRGWEIPRYDRALGLDVLHVPFNVLPTGRSRKILTIHDLAFLHVGDTFDSLERKRMSLLTAFSARRADHIFTVSEYSKRDIVEQYGIDPGMITVTPNAVDPGIYRPWPEEDTRAFRREKGVEYPFLLFVGTLQPRKNVQTLVKAFHALGPEARDVRLVLVGRKGWIYDDIFRAIGELGLARRVVHMEDVDQRTLVGLYNSALGLVFPSIFEGFGMPILEAMSCGCPVASANVTSMPEIYGDAALPFDPRDADAMAKCMARLAADDELRARLRERGFANCRRYSWEATASIVLGKYRELAGAGGRGRPG